MIKRRNGRYISLLRDWSVARETFQVATPPVRETVLFLASRAGNWWVVTPIGGRDPLLRKSDGSDFPNWKLALTPMVGHDPNWGYDPPVRETLPNCSLSSHP